MEAKELRIGNLVKVFDYKPKVEFDTIATITQYGWETVNGYNGIEPIPLTEEWLLKFGFEYHESLKFWVKNWGTNGVEFLRFDEHYGKFTFQLGTAKYKISEYVHQLQNLYFALTGEELELK